MTANQRRPGFRLPWSSETDEPGSEAGPSTPATEASVERATDPTGPDSAAERPDTSSPEAPATAAPNAGQPSGEARSQPETPAASAQEPQRNDVAAPPPATPEPPEPQEGGEEFMRDLVAAMRKVADEARESGMAELRTSVDEQSRRLDADAERRREELRARAEADIAGVGEWAAAEAERIKAEAEQRVVARRAKLEQQLAAESARAEADTKALRDRVAAYERELDAYHAQLGEIGDPAAFAAAAKRMPKAPKLSGTATAPAASVAEEAPVEPSTAPSNGVPEPAPEVHPAEEEVLAARLAELDASLPQEAAASAAEPPAPPAEPVTTEIVVKGLGSFGAITGFRQSLSGVDGVEGVALSLGQTGEFVFRATHAAGFDVGAAISTLEGDGATVEARPEGGLRVTLDRAR